MKYIKKGAEPSVFTEWKKKPANLERKWKSFRREPVKQYVLDSLLQEQGYICCYCCASITNKTCHIEHLKPQSLTETSGINWRYEYSNMMVSCDGEYEDRPQKHLHCGHKRPEEYDENLFVSPLDPNCESFFRYNGEGKILATGDADKKVAAETTIRDLGLDIPQLNARRLSAIEAIDNILESLEELTNEDISQMIEYFQEPDDNGQYQEFCNVIVYYLKNYYSI